MRYARRIRAVRGAHALSPAHLHRVWHMCTDSGAYAPFLAHARHAQRTGALGTDFQPYFSRFKPFFFLSKSDFCYK